MSVLIRHPNISYLLQEINMTLVKIWKVKWIATPNSDPMTYYFKDDKNIEPTISGWTPPFPTSSYSKEEIEVQDDSWEYKLCID